MSKRRKNLDRWGGEGLGGRRDFRCGSGPSFRRTSGAVSGALDPGEDAVAAGLSDFPVSGAFAEDGKGQG